MDQQLWLREDEHGSTSVLMSVDAGGTVVMTAELAGALLGAAGYVRADDDQAAQLLDQHDTTVPPVEVTGVDPGVGAPTPEESP